MPDGGRSPGVGKWVQAPNHLKQRWSKARVVSVEEKAFQRSQMCCEKMNASEPLMTRRKE